MVVERDDARAEQSAAEMAVEKVDLMDVEKVAELGVWSAVQLVNLKVGWSVENSDIVKAVLSVDLSVVLMVDKLAFYLVD